MSDRDWSRNRGGPLVQNYGRLSADTVPPPHRLNHGSPCAPFGGRPGSVIQWLRQAIRWARRPERAQTKETNPRRAKPGVGLSALVGVHLHRQMNNLQELEGFTP